MRSFKSFTSGFPTSSVRALPSSPTSHVKTGTDGTSSVVLSLLHTFPFVVQGTHEIRPNTDGLNPHGYSQLYYSWHVSHNVVSLPSLPMLLWAALIRTCSSTGLVSPPWSRSPGSVGGRLRLFATGSTSSSSSSMLFRRSYSPHFSTSTATK